MVLLDEAEKNISHYSLRNRLKFVRTTQKILMKFQLNMGNFNCSDVELKKFPFFSHSRTRLSLIFDIDSRIFLSPTFPNTPCVCVINIVTILFLLANSHLLCPPCHTDTFFHCPSTVFIFGWMLVNFWFAEIDFGICTFVCIASVNT